jgi:pantoate--beta-alanine ligase
VEQLRTISDQRAWSRARRQAGESIGFVPTMGALHEGHLSLVQLARSRCRRVVVSIYVNPTQFDNPEDLEKYPVTLEQDLALLSAAGVDAVYLPTTAEMYPNGYCTFVEVVGPLADKLCGVARPGHFRGVTTVVTKLFNAVQPDVAVFGQKDLQQVLIVSRMAADLDTGIEVLVGPTVRETDGLAMSSRNRRLSPEMRAKALAVPQGLELANRAFKRGERDAVKLTEHVYNELLVHPGVDVDYAHVVKLPEFSEAELADDRCVLAVAAFIDGVRLIDHVHLGGAALPVKVEG